MMFLCDRAREIWKHLGLEENILAAARIDRPGAAILEELLCSDSLGGLAMGQENTKELIMVAGWYIWWERCRLVHDEKIGKTQRSVLAIRGIVANELARKRNSPDKVSRLSKPASGVVKLNVNATFDVNVGSGAMGAILRDSSGMFIAAKNEFIQFAMEAPSMEASALRLGLEMAEHMGVQSVAIECDFMEVVQAVLNPSEYRATGAVVIDDCRKKISDFGKATIVHCNRQAFVCAHELARFSFRERSEGFWMDEPPHFLVPFIVKDLIVIE
jgi:ribonuclease HI